MSICDDCIHSKKGIDFNGVGTWICGKSDDRNFGFIPLANYCPFFQKEVAEDDIPLEDE